MLGCVVDVEAQKKSRKKPPAPKAVTELAKLREQYVQATKDYKASLEKLLSFYEQDVKKAEEKLTLSQKLLAEGLIAKAQVQESENALATAKAKVAETRRQMGTADDQIASVLVEEDADQQLAKNLSLAKQRLVRTSSFIRFTGGPGWNLGEAWKVQRFFSDTFHRELPIAVFGQGAIHDRWRLDHRNSMDISLHPDSAEGQALLNFLQRNAIPFLAFRGAIPGTATGPHIHIGRPSHRY
jgi:ribosome-binding protein aMBF1 (putative translation factor)